MTFGTQTLKRITRTRIAATAILFQALPFISPAHAAGTWDGGGDDDRWSNATNWVDDAAPASPAALTFAGSTRLTPTNDLTDVTVTNLTFAAGAGAFALGGDPITLGGNVSVLTGGSATNDQIINLPISLSKSPTLSSALVGGSTSPSTKGALIVNGVISGPFGLTSSGQNYVQLNGANTYTGDTIISASNPGGNNSFSIGNANAFGSGKLIIGATSGSGTHWVQSAGNLTVTNAVEIRTFRFVPVNYTVAGKAPGNLTLSGSVFLNHGSSGDFWCQRDLTLSGTVSGSGLRMATGKIILTGTNTFTDHLRSTDSGNVPTFNINSDAAMGHTNNGVQAVYTMNFQTAAGTDIPLAPSRSFTSYAGRTLTFDIPSASTLTVPGPMVNNGTIAKSGSGALTLSGAVSNGGGITLNTGTLTLSGASTYSGGTIVKGGVLNITTNAALGAENNPLIFTTSATLQAGATNVSLAADRTLYLTNASTYTATIDVPADFTLAMAGPIKGNVATNSSLNKSGPGTVILTGGSDGTPLGGLVTAGGKLSIRGGVWSVAPLLQADGSGFSVSGGATYEQTGGTNTIPIYAHICNYPLVLGSTSTATGMLSGGVMTGMELMVGRRGSGTLTVSGNALLDLYSLKLGESTNFTSIVNLDGGVIACTHIASRATNATQATSILNLNGGTLRAKGVAGGLIGGYGSGTISYLTQVNVRGGGAVIDSQSYAVSIPQVLEHAADLGAAPDGGLTKRGTGILTLATNNTFTGLTAIEAGTLRLSVSNSLWAGSSLWVASNAVFDVSGKAQTLAGLAGSGLVTNGSLLEVTLGVAPGTTNTIGTLTLASAPAALGGTFLTDVAADGACDRLHVRGDLDLTGLDLALANPGELNKHQRYVIATYTGSLAGPFRSAPLPNRWHVAYNTTAKEVFLRYDFGTLLMLQ